MPATLGRTLAATGDDSTCFTDGSGPSFIEIALLSPKDIPLFRGLAKHRRPLETPRRPRPRAPSGAKRARVLCEVLPEERLATQSDMEDIFGEFESSEDGGEVSGDIEEEKPREPTVRAEDALSLETEESDRPWQLKIARAQQETRKAWRTPPEHAQQTARYQLSPRGADVTGAQRGASARAAQRHHVAARKIEPTGGGAAPAARG